MNSSENLINDYAERPIDSISARSRLVGFALLLAPIVLMGAIGVRSQTELSIFAVSLLTYCLLCVPFMLKRTFYVVEPYSIIFAILYLGIPLKLVWAVAYQDSEQLRGMMQYDSVQTLLEPSLLTLLAIAMLVLGYMTSVKTRFRFASSSLPEARWNKSTLMVVCGAMVGISVLAFILYARQAGISFSGGGPLSAKRIQEGEGPLGRGSSHAYYRWAISLSQIAFYVIFAWAIKRRDSHKGVITILCMLALPLVISFLMPFVTSSRTPLVFFLVECLVILYCLKENVFTGNWLVAQIAAGTAVLALFMLILALRSGSAIEETNVEDLTPIALIDHVVGARYLADVTKVSQIYKAFPDQIPFQHGISYAAPFTAPIPRDWWPAKPAIGLGPFIGEKVYGLQRTGVPPGMFGEAYLNFGMLGMVFVPLIYGFLARLIFESVRNRLRARDTALFYAICFRFFVGALGADVSVGIVQFAMEFIPVMGAVWLIRSRSRAFY